MSRSCGYRVAWLAAIFLAAGCQNYNFNPVGHCIMQPGSKTISISSVSTADVLFVIDDSGSMDQKQQNLAQNFSSFVTALNQANLDRAAAGLKPIDFHLAVTTTSVFNSYQIAADAWTCNASCGTAGQACCASGAPVLGPRRCTSDSQCPSGNTCKTTCSFTYSFVYNSITYYLGPYDLFGESYCCNASNVAPTVDPMPCSSVGSTCGTMEKHYNFAGSCLPGVGTDGALYSRGSFVSATNPTAGPNPKVLHFDKSLYPNPPDPAATNRQGFTTADLVSFFAGNPIGTNANVKVGTCGSGQEQGLQAGKLAVQKALAGQQQDTYSMSGGKVQATSPAEWPHPNSKLVLVFVGDEDDCSSPETDPSTGIALLSTDVAGSDACVRDVGAPTPKEYSVQTAYVDYFMGLGRPVGAAFIESAAQTICGRAGYPTCVDGKCCQDNCPTNGTCGNSGSPLYCGGQAGGTRFFQAAGQFATAGADVVAGSICDSSFGTLLGEIAKMIVKLPSTLKLPSLPASGDITVLRIADSAGNTVKQCGRPAPAGMTAADANTAGYQWWFTEAENPINPIPYKASQYVYINPTGGCIANPGETYSAEYIGRLPAAGCWPSGSDTTGDTACRLALGGQLSGGEEPWTCYAPVSGSPGACGVAT